MNLPRILNTKNPKYQHLNGKPYLSYSSFNSWNNPAYRSDFIRTYFLGKAKEGTIWTETGNDIGEAIEWYGNGRVGERPTPKVLSVENIDFMLPRIEFPDNSTYEDEIVIDLGDFVLLGYTDRTTLHEGNKVDVIDYKTGNIDTKVEEYASPDYMQTNLYMYQKELEGYTPNECKVIFLGRKGNGRANAPVRLSGEIVEIPTPYNRKKVEQYLKTIRKTAMEVAEYYTTYQKYFL